MQFISWNKQMLKLQYSLIIMIPQILAFNVVYVILCKQVIALSPRS